MSACEVCNGSGARQVQGPTGPVWVFCAFCGGSGRGGSDDTEPPYRESDGGSCVGCGALVDRPGATCPQCQRDERKDLENLRRRGLA